MNPAALLAPEAMIPAQTAAIPVVHSITRHVWQAGGTKQQYW